MCVPDAGLVVLSWSPPRADVQGARSDPQLNLRQRPSFSSSSHVAGVQGLAEDARGDPVQATRPCLAVVATLLGLALQADASGADLSNPPSEVAASTSDRIPRPSLDNLANLTRRRLAP